MKLDKWMRRGEKKKKVQVWIPYFSFGATDFALLFKVTLVNKDREWMDNKSLNWQFYRMHQQMGIWNLIIDDEIATCSLKKWKGNKMEKTK